MTDDRRSWDHGFDGVRRRQALNGLSMTAAERLQWVYRMFLFFQRFGGAAQQPAAAQQPMSSTKKS